jgi:hypothetical protein
MKKIPPLPEWIERLTPETWFFLGGFVFLILLELLMQPFAIHGMYFQEWTSEDMMQTLPILALRDEPVASFVYLHIQPPLLDFFRMLLAQFFRALPDAQLLGWVDRGLYLLWAILYGLMGALLYHWLAQLTSPKAAIFGAALFLLHPAAILYATLLESTLLFTLGVLWSTYELWKLYSQPRSVRIVPLAASVVLLYFTRSIYQWPVLIVYVVSLLLMRVPGRKVITFVVLTGTVILFYTTKQLYLFGIPYTSSFAAHNCFHGLGSFTDYAGWGVGNIPLEPPISDAMALTLKDKLTGVHNWNNYDDLQYHRALFPLCSQQLLNQPLSQKISAYLGNLVIYIQPSARFTTPHVIADRLPWRDLYNRVFSGLPLILLTILATTMWLIKNGRQRFWRGLGLILPTLYIFIASVTFERGENMRYKFFIEPVLYIFIFSQFYAFWQEASNGLRKQTTPKPLKEPSATGEER